MSFIKFISFFIVFFSLSVYSKDVQLNLSYNVYSDLTANPYLEVFASVNGQSVKYLADKKNKNLLEAKVKILLTIKNITTEKEKNIILKDSLIIKNKVDTSTKKLFNNFYGLKKIPIKNGYYTIIIEIKDEFSESKHVTFNQRFNVDYNYNKVALSEIIPLRGFFETKKENFFTKNKKFIIPYPSNFYPESIKKLIFYTEIYPHNKIMSDSKQYTFNYSIEKKETEKLTPIYSKTDSISLYQISKNIYSIDISELQNGNYYLTTKLLEKDLVIEEKEFFFQRTNKKNNILISNNKTLLEMLNQSSLEDLIIYMRMLIPLAQPNEKKIISILVKSKDIPKIQTFFENFWTIRSKTPSTAWNDYFKQARIVDVAYKTPIKRGFLTDRGKVYLKYGKPNTISKFSKEANAYPYEIWHYYKAKNFSNIKFVFYSPDGATNDFIMLHSNIPGEIKNNQWRIVIHGRTNQVYDHDQTDIRKYEGDRSKDFFDNPR